MIISLLLLVSCIQKTESIDNAVQPSEAADSSVSSFGDGMDSVNNEEKEMNGEELSGIDSGLSEVENS